MTVILSAVVVLALYMTMANYGFLKFDSVIQNADFVSALLDPILLLSAVTMITNKE